MDEKQKFQEKIADFGGAIGALVAAIMAVMDDRIRPHLVAVWERVKLSGLNTRDFIRELYDRQIVSAILRPWLACAFVLVVILVGVPFYFLQRVDSSIPSEMMWALAVVGPVALIAMGYQYVLVSRVRSVDVTITDWTSLSVRERTQQKANELFGRAGLAPSTVLAILGGQLVAAFEVGAMAVLLRAYPSYESGHYTNPRISIIFAVIAASVIGGVGLQYVGLARLVSWVIVTGTNLVTDAFRVIFRGPVVTFIAGVTDSNVDQFMPPGLGLPHKEAGKALTTGHKYPFGIAALLLACFVPEHDPWTLVGLLALCIVLPFVHVGLTWLTPIKAEWIYNAIVTSFVVFACVATVRRLMGTSIWSDLRALGSMWTMLAHTDYLPLLVVGGGAVALGVLAYKYIPHKQVSYPLLYIGLFIGLLTLGLCAFHMVQESPLPGEARATTHASTPSAPSASAPRAPRSPSVAESHGS